MAGNTVPVSIKLTAVDQVTAKVAAINSKLARIIAPVTKYQTAFQGLSKEMGIEKVGASLAKVGSAGSDFFGDIMSGASKAALAVAAAGGSIFALANSFAQSGDNIANTAKRLGMTTDAFQELAYAANQADISQEEFAAAMTKLQKGMVEARMGTGEAMHAFDALGISMRKNDGKVKSSEEVFAEFADGILSVKDASLQTALTMKVFGRGGGPMLTLLSQGAAGIKKFREEARRVGAVMDENQIKAAQEFDDGMKSVGATLTGIKNIIGAELAPEVLKLGKQFQAFLLDNRDDIKKFVQEFAKNLPGAIAKAVEFAKQFWQSLQPVINMLGKLVETFGASTVALTAFVGYFFGPAIGSFLKLALAIGESIGPLAKFAWQMGSLALGPLINGISNFFLALRAGYPILQAVGLALAANPIALWGTAIAAVVTVVYQLWKNWDAVTGAVGKAWRETRRFFGAKIDEPAGPSAELPKGAFGLNMGPEAMSGSSFNSQLGAPIGAQGVVLDAAKGSVNKTENQISVRFENPPKGTRIEIEKSESPIDLYQGPVTAGFN